MREAWNLAQSAFCTFQRGRGSGGRGRATLSYLLQSCHRLSGARTEQHDRIVDFTQAGLQRKGFIVLMEPNIPSPTGIRKPDLVVWKEGREAWVLDTQVVADANLTTPEETHARKPMEQL